MDELIIPYLQKEKCKETCSKRADRRFKPCDIRLNVKKKIECRIKCKVT